ncbi:DEAD/DEAH box helicase family protein [Ruminococcus sp. NK3A76]|uniref:DEAD/DEAH box helicase n=1 Tax=Ruminococcus sp. NK3A76 TaxID=877411 RepID=UPI00048D1E94|nr:DEAD/DEAH box helicase family protein [Ruminococcus sp. NK3A76]
MELNSYQREVMGNLSAYLSALNETGNLDKAWLKYWNDQDVAVGLGPGSVPSYRNSIKGVPHVCMKVPTGGGKTFMACAAVRRIFDALPQGKPKMVVWLVPSDPILVQTTTNLMNPDHPYTRRLNADFGGRVGVFTKEMLLNGQNFTPDTVHEQLTVCILSYSSLRIDSKKKDVRKVYQENGNLKNFSDQIKDKTELLKDTPDTALIQVLRHLSPVVIVDESHNAGSDLSVEMLNNLNPSFVLDLTATPRKNSNIISYVDARKLKKENMVKLPVIVYNRTSRDSVIDDAIHLRGILEQQAIEEEERTGKYIRPIVLFQAQPKNNNDNDTFDKVKEILLGRGIPAEQIAIKTSKVNDLGKTDLMSRDCPIRYIITVNALKEGWDCPFAYILASLANKTSKVDVEQILGRILRQPYARKHSMKLLNSSFVLTCSNAFHDTLDSIVAGLNNAGFSRKDYRTAETLPITETEPPVPEPQPEQTTMQFTPEPTPEAETEDDFSDIHTPVEPAPYSETVKTAPPSVEEMISQAEETAEQYEEETKQDNGWTSDELDGILKSYRVQEQFTERVQELKIPQFCIESVPDLFGGNTALLTKESLMKGFSLSEQDASVTFSLSTGEMFEIDVESQGEAVPKYKKLSSLDDEYMRKLLAKLAPEEKIEHCTKLICHEINRDNAFSTSEVENYVRRIIANMTEDNLAALETSYITYATRIKEKIKTLREAYMQERFYDLIERDRVFTDATYTFPMVITPSESTDKVPKSLYEAEWDKMNNFERRTLDVIAGCEGVLWWHRIIEKKGFHINGFINHYPDFIVMMKSGKIVLVEAKGDDRDNGDSRTKLKLGQTWAAQAGRKFKYFMTFDQNSIEGAYNLEDFAEVLRDL